MLPTYLYIKQHSITKQLYFGKSTRSESEMIRYLGSGKYWKSHLTKHGKYVDTIWYCLFTDLEECTKFALMFSEQQNIVESKNWANLRFENGLDGGANGGVQTPWTTERRIAQSLRRKGKATNAGFKHTEEWKKQHALAVTGLPQTAEMRLKNSIAHRHPQLQVTCPHCDKTGGQSLMKRYHYDNCKRK